MTLPIGMGSLGTCQYQVSPRTVRVRDALERACRQLPLSIAVRISVIRYGPEGVIDPHFEVEFKGGKVIHIRECG